MSSRIQCDLKGAFISYHYETTAKSPGEKRIIGDSLRGGYPKMQEQVIVFLLRAPQWVLSAAVGALAGGACYLLPAKVRRVAMAGIFMLAFNLVNTCMDSLHKQYDYLLSLEALKSNRLISDALRFAPSEEVKLRDDLRSLMAKTPRDKLMGPLEQLTGNVVNDVFAKTLPRASDDAVYHFLEANQAMLDTIKDQPSLCVEFFAGADGTPIEPKQLPADLMQRVADTKADIIESAMRSPSPTSKAKDVADFLDPLLERYKLHNQSARDVIKIYKVAQLERTEGCAVARFFVSTLV